MSLKSSSHEPATAECPACGTALSPTAPHGLCSRCLVRNVLVPQDTPPSGFSVRSLEEVQALFPNFEVRSYIGRGGMGTVYEAWQPSLSRPVALKLLPPELLCSEDFFDRFQREARLMAQMDHPNVARVFDSGLTPGGDAYIIMELVRGEPITSYVARRRVLLRQRLEIFAQVCNGVQHAHQKGVIHRDLKPSNILVAESDGVAVPKIIDFGLARPVDQKKADTALWFSARKALGTPAYMSPEQACGEQIDSRSDIYSLGILLFELLTGHNPLHGQIASMASIADLRDTINQTELPPPSRVVSEPIGSRRMDDPGENNIMRAAREQLEGDLDAIVLRAAHRVPSERYQTAAALPEELARHFSDQPVMAVVPTPAYLTGKFVRRHRLALGITGAFLLILLGGAGLFVQESYRTRRAEQLAVHRLRQGEHLIEFMLGDLRGKLESVGRLDVLKATAREVENFYANSGETYLRPESLFHRARAMFQLGLIRAAQGELESALEDYRGSIRLLEAAVSARPNNLAWREELGQVWNSLAVFHHGLLQTEAARAAYEQALKHADYLLQKEPENATWINYKASLLHNYGAFCDMVGDLNQAESNYAATMQLWKPLQARAPDNPQLLEHLSHLYANQALVHGHRKQMAEAKQCNAEALRLRERLVQLDPNNMRALQLLADIQQNIAEVHFQCAELAEAQTWMDRYRPIREQLAARDPQNAQWQQLLAEAWANYALLQERLGNFKLAADAHRKWWKILAPRLSASVEFPSKYIAALRSADPIFLQLAEQSGNNGDLSSAREYWEDLVELRAQFLEANRSDTEAQRSLADACLQLARVQLQVGAADEGAALAHLAFFFFRNSLDPAPKLPLSDEQEQLFRSVLALDELGSALSSLDSVQAIDPSYVVAALGQPTLRWPPGLAMHIREQLPSP